MKKVIISLLFILFAEALANPISPNLFSELLFTSDGWLLELKNLFGYFFDDSLSDDYFVLQSDTDTVIVKNTFHPDSAFIVISSVDLESTLMLDASGDKLRVGIFTADGLFWINELTYGENGVIAAPQPGQSICFGRFHYIDVPMTTYYLDNSPTIGAVNDTAGAQGRAQGIIVDPYGMPIPGAVVRSCYISSGWPFFSVETDSNGQFEFNTISYNWLVQIVNDGYRSQTRYLQVWPDSTVEIEIVLQPEPEYYQSYFPLQKGNSWTYISSSSSQFTVTIDDTVTINNRQYYNMTNSFFRFDSLGNVMQYLDGKDILKFPLTLSENDSLIIGDSTAEFFGIIKIVKNKDGYSVPAGKFTDVLTIHIFSSLCYTGMCDGTMNYSFAKNVGLIHHHIEGGDFYGYDLMSATVNGVSYPTSGIQKNPTQADKYALKLENYPNPFNSSTTLKYHLPEESDIRLNVFDLNGRLVEHLFSGRQPAADYHYFWSGGSLPSGVYFISLNTGDQQVIRKCMLVK